MALEGTALSNRPEDGERQAIEAARHDPHRFADLYEENFERVYAFVVRRVRHREEAQDLTAEVFNRALANLDRYQWRGAPFAAWLFRIAATAIADRAHRSARGPPCQSRLFEITAATPGVLSNETWRIQ